MRHDCLKIKVMFGYVFVFYFQKLVFENIKKKLFSCIFEIKNMFGYLKLKKKKKFFKEKIENNKICCY